MIYKVGIFLYILSKEVLLNFNYMNGKTITQKLTITRPCIFSYEKALNQ